MFINVGESAIIVLKVGFTMAFHIDLTGKKLEGSLLCRFRKMGLSM